MAASIALCMLSGAINVMLTSPMPATMMAENNAVNIPNLNDERGVSVGFATANLSMKNLRSHRQPTNLSIHSGNHKFGTETVRIDHSDQHRDVDEYPGEEAEKQA